MRVYAYMFFRVSQLFARLSDDGLSEWKAHIVIGTAEGIFLVDVWACCRWIFDLPLPTSKPILPAVLLAILIAVANYSLFKSESQRKRYESEFQHYSKGQRIRGSLFIFGFFVVIAVATFAAGNYFRPLPIR